MKILLTTVIVSTMVVFLVGCQTTKLVPVYTFPEPPAELMVPGQALKPIQKPVTASVTNNATNT